MVNETVNEANARMDEQAAGRSQPTARNGARRRFLNLAGLLAVLLGVAAASPPTAAAPGCRLAVLGDSLAAGYGVALDEAFPARLEAALAAAGTPCEVLNAGVSGDTTAGGLARLDWVLGDAPTHLLVELGGNDALRAIPVEAMEANLAGIIEGAEAAGVEVMLAGMLAPPNLGARYTDAFAAVFERLAERYDVPLYPFFLDGAIQDPDLMAEDGIHPNAAGVAVIVERILPYVVTWLDGAAA
jgi:acyl-CoA thioesterase-1